MRGFFWKDFNQGRGRHLASWNGLLLLSFGGLGMDRSFEKKKRCALGLMVGDSQKRKLRLEQGYKAVNIGFI